MGTEITVLILPLVLILVPCLFMKLKRYSDLTTRRSGPLLSTEALDQLILLFVIYFILLLVPIAGKMAGAVGQPIALVILFIIVVSLMIRFKKLSND